MGAVAWFTTPTVACGMPAATTSPASRPPGIQPSMSRAGCSYDNAMAESFMRTLKHEEVDASAYRDLAHARAAIDHRR